jgi:hypothetical protein
MGRLATWYKQRLRDWIESYLAELAKGVLVLLGLGIFRVAILAVGLTGIDREYLALLEQLHFWLTYGTIAALGMYFLLKLIAGML